MKSGVCLTSCPQYGPTLRVHGSAERLLRGDGTGVDRRTSMKKYDDEDWIPALKTPKLRARKFIKKIDVGRPPCNRLSRSRHHSQGCECRRRSCSRYGSRSCQCRQQCWAPGSRPRSRCCHHGGPRRGARARAMQFRAAIRAERAAVIGSKRERGGGSVGGGGIAGVGVTSPVRTAPK